MPIGSSLGITLPTQGGNTGTWGTDLNTEISKIVTAVEAQVPVAALDVSTDFDFNSFAATDVAHVSFVPATPTELNSVYSNGTDLFYRDGTNNPIQLTANGTLNNASAGGLGDSGGTYGTSGIILDWDGTRYKALNGSGIDSYANVRMSSLELRDGSSNTLTVDVPAMGSDYTLSLPPSTPGSAAFVQMDSSGNLTASNTMTQSITLSSGDITLTTGSVIYTRTIDIPGSAFYSNSNNIKGTTRGNLTVGAVLPVSCELPIPVGCTITSIAFNYSSDATSANRFCYLYEQPVPFGSPSVQIAGDAAFNAFPQDTTLTLDGVIHTVARGCYLTFVPAGVNDDIDSVQITYTNA